MVLTVLQTVGKGCNINKDSLGLRCQGLSNVRVSKAANILNTKKQKQKQKQMVSVQQVWNFRRRGKSPDVFNYIGSACA